MSARNIHAEVELGVCPTRCADSITVAGLVSSKRCPVGLSLNLVVTLCGNHGTIGQELLQVSVVAIPAVSSIWRVTAHVIDINDSKLGDAFTAAS